MPLATARPPARAGSAASLLERLLDEVLEEQFGPNANEQLAGLARAVGDWRSTGQSVRALAERLADTDAGRLARACSIKLAVASLAEQHPHREPGPHPALEEIAALLRAAAGASLPALRLVLTAHPTDIARRSVLTKQRTIARCLDALDDPRLGLHQRRTLEAEIREALAIWLATNEIRSMRPRVSDEVRRLLFFFETVLFDAAADLAFELALVLGSPLSVPPVRFGSWAGGDMDGNPEVSATTIRETLRAHRTLALELLLARIGPLRQAFSQSDGALAATDALRESLRRDERELPQTAALLAERYPHEAHEPLRRKLAFLAARLADDLRETRGEQAGGFGYRVPEGLLDDLLAVRSSVGSRFVACGRIERLIWQVRTFGFHLATLELRENAPEIQATCRALLPGYAGAADEAARQALLDAACRSDRVAARDGLAEPRVAAALDCLARAHEAFGARSLDTFIVSGAEAPSDVLCLLWLARRAGVAGQLELVPLFERRVALERATETMAALYASPAYAAQLRTRGCSQEVMLGYSDAGKDAGYIASQWSIYQAQERLAGQAREHGVTLRLFQGRGGSPARGGGPAHATIGAASPGALGGQLKVTEQGEVITAKYRNRRLAVRSLAETLAAVTGAVLRPSAEPRPEWRAALSAIADEAEAAYRAMVFEEPEFWELFRRATPIDAVSRLNLGSRPAARGAQHGIDSLRAIPWVFAWTQSRLCLPGWYGAGAAFRSASPGLVAEMYAGWPFFAALISNLERAIGSTDMPIAAEYLDLAQAPARLVRTILADYEQCVQSLRAITGRDPVRSEASARQTWLDGLAFLQVALLRRVRRGEQAAHDPLLATVAGIATGLGTTG